MLEDLITIRGITPDFDYASQINFVIYDLLYERDKMFCLMCGKESGLPFCPECTQKSMIDFTQHGYGFKEAFDKCSIDSFKTSIPVDRTIYTDVCMRTIGNTCLVCGERNIEYFICEECFKKVIKNRKLKEKISQL